MFPGLEKITASSWTDDYGVAERFATGNPQGYVSMVLVADSSAPQNYFIDAGPLYNYEFAAGFSNEDEVIGVGDLEIKEIIWLYGE